MSLYTVTTLRKRREVQTEGNHLETEMKRKKRKGGEERHYLSLAEGKKGGEGFTRFKLKKGKKVERTESRHSLSLHRQSRKKKKNKGNKAMAGRQQR